MAWQQFLQNNKHKNENKNEYHKIYLNTKTAAKPKRNIKTHVKYYELDKVNGGAADDDDDGSGDADDDDGGDDDDDDAGDNRKNSLIHSSCQHVNFFC